MADKDGRGFRGGWLKQCLAFGVVLIAVAAGVFLAVSGQAGGSKTASPAHAKQASRETDVLADAILPVEGMSCGACAARIKRTLKDMDGVADVEVSLVERNVRVRYADGKVTAERLTAAINELGYKARSPTAAEAGAGEPNVKAGTPSGKGE